MESRRPKHGKVITNILLTTISPSDDFEIQLALYYLKSCFENSPAAVLGCATIKTRTFHYKDSVKRIFNAILDYRPKIIGFSCYIWNIDKILQLAKLLKKSNPGIIIILGGPEVSPRFRELFAQEKAIDIIVRGEGEETFVGLVNSLVYQKLDLSEIEGIAYRKNENIFVNPPRPLMQDLNRIPSPYLQRMIKVRHEYVPIETMRGCAFRCSYCYYHKEFGELRLFSFQRIKAELKYILAQKPKIVYLMDPTFNIYPQRAKEILRFFIAHNINSRLHTEIRAELLDKEMVDLLSKARVTKLEIGLQSTHGGVLKGIFRTLRKSVFKEKLRLLNKNKIKYEVHLIDALPGHTLKKIKQSLDWLFLLRPPEIRIMRLCLLPGTYLREHAQSLGIEFEPTPPYYWRRTPTLSDEDRKKIIVLTNEMSTLNYFLPNSMYFLAKQLGISFTAILEKWIMWKRAGNKKKLHNIPQKFISYLCKKYRKPSVYREAYDVFLKKDFPSLSRYYNL